MNRARPLRWLVFSGILGFLLGGGWGFWNARETSPEHGVAGSPVKPAVAAVAAELDPDLLNDPLKDLPAEALPHAGTLDLLARIAKAKAEDLPGLLLEIQTLKDNGYEVRQTLWDRWVELDPEGGFAHVRTLPSPPFTVRERRSMVWDFTGRWSLRDPDKAVLESLALPEQRDREVSISRIADTLAMERPVDFFRLLPELSKDNVESANWYLQRTAAAYAATDPAAALRALENVTAEQRALMLPGIAAGWAERDADAAVEWVRKLTDENERVFGLRGIAKQIVQDRPELAAKIYLEGGLRHYEDESDIGLHPDTPLKRVAEKLATAKGGVEAVRWLEKYFPEQMHEFGVSVTALALQLNTWEAVVEQMTQMPESVAKRLGFSSEWMGYSFSDDIQAGLEKAAAIENPEVRDSLHAMILTFQAKTEPETAITAARGHGLSEKALGQVARRALQTWASEDLTAASAWLAQQPPGAERDGTIAGFNEVARVAEPDSALQWAMAVDDSRAREMQVAQVLYHWKRTDPATAEAALNGLSLPDEEKAALAKRVFPKKP